MRGRDPVNGMCSLPTNPTALIPAQSTVDIFGLKLMPHQTMAHGAKFFHTILYKQNQLKYMRKSMFCLPIATLIKDIDNDFL